MAKSTPEERAQFRIGDWVTVSGWAAPQHDERGARTYFALDHRAPRVGQVVGAGRLMVGKRYPAGYGEDYEPPEFRATGSVLVWWVRYSVATRPEACFAHQLTPCEARDRLPWAGRGGAA